MEFKEITEKMENEIVEMLPAGNDIWKVEDGFIAKINNVKTTHQRITINEAAIEMGLADGMEVIITELAITVYFQKVRVASVDLDVIEDIRIL